MASKLKVVIFLGTTREGRLGPRVAKFVQDHLKSKYDVTLFGERFNTMATVFVLSITVNDLSIYFFFLNFTLN